VFARPSKRAEATLFFRMVPARERLAFPVQELTENNGSSEPFDGQAVCRINLLCILWFPMAIISRWGLPND